MLVRENFDGILKTIGVACSLTETKFLEAGKNLETSIETLGSLTTTFERLFEELNGENVQRATQDLAQAVSYLSDLANAHNGEKETLGRLAGLTATIQNGVSLIHKTVRSADLLTISAKMAAAHIGAAGGDFITFAEDISHTLKLAQTTLDRFRDELGEVGRHLNIARTGQIAFEEQQTETIRALPQHLAISVDAIAARGKQALAAASAVQERSKQVSQRIGVAVMALQIGDKTRQRIEHATFAFDLLRKIFEGDVDAELLPSNDEQRRSLLALGCRLQAAQLEDAAEDFDHEIRQIQSALEKIAGDAREILRLGNDTYGGTEARRGPFLLDLKEDVSRARALLQGFGLARRDVDKAVATVSDTGASLVGHISTVRSLEADIRIMGLNATLKCGRLGSEGRPLSVIAQELRVYANHIAERAGTVMADLEGVVGTAASLSVGQREKGAVDIASVAEMMTVSVDRLGTAGDSLANALAALERDSVVVVELLEATAKHVTAHEEISKAMRAAAAELARVAPDANDDELRVEANTPPHRHMLEMVARTYTMARERVVHERIVHGTDAPASSGGNAPGQAETTVDDLLF